MTNQQPSKPIQKAVKLILGYAPVGSAGFALLSSMINSEWGNAIIAFPSTVLTTIWANYSQAFLDRLTEIYSEDGRKGADAFKRFTDSLSEAIKWTLAATDDKYLKYQSYKCQEDQIEGFNQLFIPQLEDVFVPLALDGTGETKNSNIFSSPKNNHNLSEEESNEIEIWDLLKSGQKNYPYRRLLIKSQGGYGKTTLLKHITYLYTQKRHPRDAPKLLPILLRLRNWQEKIYRQKTLDLPILIEEYHLPNITGGNILELPSKWAKNNLNKGNFLILLDGFDEVKPQWRETVSKWLGQQMSHYPNSFFILTSRPKGYDEGYYSKHKPSATLFIKPFNLKQIQKFVKSWYLCQEILARGGRKNPDIIKEANEKAVNLLRQLYQRKELASLATNPLLLNMIVCIHRYYPSQKLPQRRTELYQTIFRLQLEDRPKFRNITMFFSAKDSQKILQFLALFLVKENRSSLDYNELKKIIQEAINSLEESCNSQTFIEQIEQVSELLVKTDDYYEFAHLSFQNYLASQEIQRTHQENLILTHWQDSDIWKETTRLYVAQLRNPSSFIGRLIDIQTPEAIALAHECLKETPREVDDKIKEQLQSLLRRVHDVRYQRLTSLLINQQFQKAEKETYRLMIEIMGKEQGQSFDKNDFELFPSEELRTLDKLWFDNSRGQFGFRVQKKIYIDNFGKTQDYNETRWYEFCERVGWRKEDDYVSYSEIIFNLRDSPPFGHLPVVFQFSQERMALLLREELEDL